MVFKGLVCFEEELNKMLFVSHLLLLELAFNCLVFLPAFQGHIDSTKVYFLDE